MSVTYSNNTRSKPCPRPWANWTTLPSPITSPRIYRVIARIISWRKPSDQLGRVIGSPEALLSRAATTTALFSPSSGPITSFFRRGRCYPNCSRVPWQSPSPSSLPLSLFFLALSPSSPLRCSTFTLYHGPVIFQLSCHNFMKQQFNFCTSCFTFTELFYFPSSVWDHLTQSYCSRHFRL